MIKRFDHAVIGVPDLETGMATFRRLGFEVNAGGRHPSLGTRNAIVRFGLDYLELLSVEDPDLAKARGPFGSDLVAFLEKSSGLVGFVLAGTDLGQQARGLATLGVGADGPFDMDRIRPDGRRLAWRLVVPAGSPWRKPWPYLIDWITPETDLLAWDPPGEHNCGASGVAGIDLVIEDLAVAERLYDQGLGLRPHRVDPDQTQTGARHCQYRLGNFLLGLHQPTAPGSMWQELHGYGPGPFRLILSTPRLASTAQVLTRRGILFSETPDGLDIDPDAALGVRVRISSG